MILTKREILIEEILKNSRSDRESVEKIRDSMIESVGGEVVMEEPGLGLTPIVIAENIARLSDVLNKNNAQLIELVKMISKEDAAAEREGADRDSIFDEIESPHSN